MVQVLGGQVDSLVEAYEFQQRFQGDRVAKETSSGEPTAPKFTHFVPGKTRVPNPHLEQGNSRPKPGAVLAVMLQACSPAGKVLQDCSKGLVAFTCKLSGQSQRLVQDSEAYSTELPDHGLVSDQDLDLPSLLTASSLATLLGWALQLMGMHSRQGGGLSGLCQGQ